MNFIFHKGEMTMKKGVIIKAACIVLTLLVVVVLGVTLKSTATVSCGDCDGVGYNLSSCEDCSGLGIKPEDDQATNRRLHCLRWLR